MSELNFVWGMLLFLIVIGLFFKLIFWIMGNWFDKEDFFGICINIDFFGEMVVIFVYYLVIVI